MTVTSTTPLDLDVTLNRIVAALDLFSTDGRSASATKIRTTFAKGGKAFNPITGLATSDTGFSQINNLSAAVGSTINVRAFPFLVTDEETMVAHAGELIDKAGVKVSVKAVAQTKFTELLEKSEFKVSRKGIVTKSFEKQQQEAAEEGGSDNQGDNGSGNSGIE